MLKTCGIYIKKYWKRPNKRLLSGGSQDYIFLYSIHSYSSAVPNINKKDKEEKMKFRKEKHWSLMRLDDRLVLACDQTITNKEFQLIETLWKLLKRISP